MELTDVKRMADSVLREYGVPMKVSTIIASGRRLDGGVRQQLSRRAGC